MRKWLLTLPVVGLVALAFVGPSSCTRPKSSPGKPLSHWLVYLQSDFSYMGTNWPQGQEPGATARCASEKFEEIWGLTDALIDQAARDRASLNLFANLDKTTPTLADRVVFNRSNPEIADVEKENGSPEDQREDLRRLREKIASMTKTVAREKHAQMLRRAPQHTQNIFQLIEAMRAEVPEALRLRDSVVVVFVSDMVHYNTSEPSQTNLEKGYLNMLQDPDREALLNEQKMDARWWLKGIPLDPLSLTKPTAAVEVRTVLVNRCPSGESLPGNDAPDWPRIRADAKQFWSRVIENLGARVIWNYQPKLWTPSS